MALASENSYEYAEGSLLAYGGFLPPSFGGGSYDVATFRASYVACCSDGPRADVLQDPPEKKFHPKWV